MPTNIITAIASAIAAVFSWMTNRSTAKNAADVKAAEITARDEHEQDKVNDAIEKRKIDEIRNDLAE
jgi:hypothetical protein